MRSVAIAPVIFMGTPSFSVPFLDALFKSGRNVAGVVTQPDKPKGRGRRVTPPPVKEFALRQAVPVYQPPKLSDPAFIESIREINPAYIVVVAYGKLIPPAILEIPEKGCINVHASLLPEYRGASPIQWAILHGRPYTGVTTMMMDEGLDTGDILLQEKIDIERSDTAGSLSAKLSGIGVKLLIRTLDGLDRGEIVPAPQDHEKATYAPLLKKEDGLIEWRDRSENIFNKIRGLDPWPGAYTFYQGERWGVWKGEVLDGRFPSSAPGEIVEVRADRIVVVTGDGSFEIKEIQAEGKRRMGVGEYLRGHKVERGTVLSQGSGDIDTA